MNDLIRKVEEFVSPVYLVGGSVRDIILGHTPRDFDFATPLLPDEVEARIKASGRRAYQIGNSKRHGTIACKVDGQEVQITTFRTETYVEGSRKPAVQFVSDLEEDLSRRDFTMNAMALDSSGQLIDPYGGQEALKHQVLCSVGNAVDRIVDDPLRMLRAVRFESQLGFLPNEELRAAMITERGRILTISKERWVQELDKMLLGHHVAAGIRTFEFTGLMRFMLPEFGSLLDDTIIERIAHAPEDVNQRWKILLDGIWFLGCSNLPKPYDRLFRKDVIRKIAFHLKFSKERTNYLLDHC